MKPSISAKLQINGRLNHSPKPHVLTSLAQTAADLTGFETRSGIAHTKHSGRDWNGRQLQEWKETNVDSSAEWRRPMRMMMKSEKWSFRSDGLHLFGHGHPSVEHHPVQRWWKVRAVVVCVSVSHCYIKYHCDFPSVNAKLFQRLECIYEYIIFKRTLIFWH